jgi:hypothetical protein
VRSQNCGSGPRSTAWATQRWTGLRSKRKTTVSLRLKTSRPRRADREAMSAQPVPTAEAPMVPALVEAPMVPALVEAPMVPALVEG